MSNKSSIMIDLEDPRTAKIAEVISNKTAKRILSALAEREMSESELASELGMALNTVGYNIKKLEDAGLIEKVKGFLWSVKGKRIHKYRVSNRRIVISPRSLIRGVIPAVLISGAVALFIKMFVGVEKSVSEVGTDVARSADSGIVAEKAIESYAAPSLSEGVSVGARSVSDVLWNAPNSWAWFFLGALTALLILIIWNSSRTERRRK